jgi:hypothetical protein
LIPFALGGLPTVDNICLRCKAHNLHAARDVFGVETIAAKCAQYKPSKSSKSERIAPGPEPSAEDTTAKVHAALRTLGFREAQVRAALQAIRQRGVQFALEPMIRAALETLVPNDSAREVSPRRSS